MKCKVDRGDFLAALKDAAKVAPSKPSMAVLAMVRLECRPEGGALLYEVTDLDTTLRDSLPAAVSSPGVVLVDAKQAAKVVSKMPAGELAVSVDGARVVVEAEGGPRVEVVAMAGDEADAWPMTPEMPEGPGVEVDGPQLAELLKAVRHAVSTDASRPNLCGVYFVATGSVLRAVATDGHRLAQAEMVHEGDKADGIIIPAKGVDTLLAHAHGPVVLRRAHGSGNVLDTSAAAANSLAVSVPSTGGSASIFLRLMDAAFPDYRQVIPTEGAGSRVAFDVAALRSTLGVAGVLASERTHGVRMDFGAEGGCECSSDNPDLGKARGVVAFEGDAPAEGGKPVVIACNVAYFEQALAVLPSDKADVQVSAGLAPMVVRPHGEGHAVDSLHVIMPMRL